LRARVGRGSLLTRFLNPPLFAGGGGCFEERWESRYNIGETGDEVAAWMVLSESVRRVIQRSHREVWKMLSFEIRDFARLLLGVDSQNPTVALPAQLYRAGATNAADRGVDIWVNLRQEFRNEFPFSTTFEPFFRQRGYDQIYQPDSPFWFDN